MNKYLEKIAVVKHMVKARRRLVQMLHEGSHDFKQMDIDSAVSALKSKNIHAGKWGTNGAGVYAGHKAPAHGYQPSGSTEPHIAFPSQPEHAVPHDKNHRFHYHTMPIQDSVIPHSVALGKGTHVVIPGGSNKPSHIGEKHLQHDLEPHIRSSRSRRLYGDQVKEELGKRGLTNNHWDGGNHLHTGEEYLRHISDKLKDNAHKIPNTDLRHAVKTMGGDHGLTRDFIHNNTRRAKRIYGNSSEIRQSLRSHALDHIAETGAYRKYLD